MILVVFHTAGINEKKKEKKKILYRTWMGYCLIEFRACAARCWGAGARRRGRWALGETACWRWARRAGAQAAGMAAGAGGAGGALGAQQAQAWAGVGAGGRAGCWAQARVAGVRTGANVRGRALACADGRGRARQGAR